MHTEGASISILLQKWLQPTSVPLTLKMGKVRTKRGNPRVHGVRSGFLLGSLLDWQQRPRLQQERVRLGYKKTVLSETSGGNTVGKAGQSPRGLSLAIGTRPPHPSHQLSQGISVKPWDVRKSPEILPSTPSCHSTAEPQSWEGTCPSHPVRGTLGLEPKS